MSRLSEVSADLEPADLNQCQAEKYAPFQLGGNLRARCTNKPAVIAIEKRPDDKGQIGSMSLCGHCKGKLIEKMGEDYADFEPVPAASAAKGEQQ